MTRRVVLVTGHSGLIGRATMARFAAHGIEAVGLARHPTQNGVAADIFDAIRIREVVEQVRPTDILHLAWDVTPGEFVHSGKNLDWVAATLMFARAAAAGGVERFVGVGTCAEYDWTDGGAAPRRETDPTVPDALYGMAKDATHRLLDVFFRAEGVGFAWARPFHLFGPGESPRRLVGGIVETLRQNRIFVCRHGQLLRDFIATADLGEALVRLVLSDAEGPVNVASGEAIRLGELAAILADRMGKRALLDAREEPSQPAAMLADVTRLREEIGFRPLVPVRDRLAAFLD
jgi:nucleoside-diphosphate-sugar epimerase